MGLAKKRDLCYKELLLVSYKFVKKALIVAIIIVIIFLFGGLGGVFFERFVLPQLSSVKSLESYSLFKKAGERTTIINKTEQVVVREDDSVEKIISQPATAVVNIVTVFDSSSTTKKGSQIIGGRQVETRTGVLLTNDGLIVTYTNEAPLEQGVSYSVLLFDGKNYKARFAGYDTLTNLAYFRIEDTITVPAIAFANSDDARTGKRLIVS